MKKRYLPDWVWLVFTHVLVAMLAALVTLVLFVPKQGGVTAAGGASGKLQELEQVIQKYFIGEVDSVVLEDAAADAMVTATGDRWSYYISASQMQAYTENKENSYVGIGVTIQVREDNLGFEVIKVEPSGSAKEAGILPGDVITQVNGQDVVALGTDGTSKLIRGDIGTTVDVTVLRDGTQKTFTVTRRLIEQAVAWGKLLDGNIGYVRIANFNARCADESIAVIEELIEQGAESLLFDVRFNPGGYKDELVKLLDYLLPKGDLFRSVDYRGNAAVDSSDARCLKMPMAVLVNGDSYSAAEFFAAALEEYDYAFIAGEPTTGKGYFQTTIYLSDGSAVSLSIGKYYTPKGVSLAEVGGLVPEVLVEVDEETEALIYSEVLPPEEDTQVQAAIAKLLAKQE